MEQSDVDGDKNMIEEVNISLFDMPIEYSLGHCIAKDMRMSAGIAIDFKLMNKHFKYEISTVILFLANLLVNYDLGGSLEELVN